MKTIVRWAAVAAVLATGLGVSGAASAKMEPLKLAQHTLGGDALVIIPVGDFADVTAVGFGALVRYEFRLVPPVTLTGRIGFVGHIAHDLGRGFDSRTWEVPILFGARYYSKLGIWGGAEMGPVIVGGKARGPGGTIFANNSRTYDAKAKFGLVLTGGYRWRIFDAGFGFFVPDIDDLFGFMFSFGINFASFGR
ncbi:MAG: hypothetical protein H6744_10295 [Deltaproteobacteria bacterium]|nr:hypothetical protein [Deltaproteobacteria bacterium]MCB9787067.1 hypothetical protein [Deltaproteobacteria bacterium]